jgi:hypothetical protein
MNTLLDQRLVRSPQPDTGRTTRTDALTRRPEPPTIPSSPITARTGTALSGRAAPTAGSPERRPESPPDTAAGHDGTAAPRPGDDDQRFRRAGPLHRLAAPDDIRVTDLGVVEFHGAERSLDGVPLSHAHLT